jgi:hypothetical protein
MTKDSITIRGATVKIPVKAPPTPEQIEMQDSNLKQMTPAQRAQEKEKNKEQIFRYENIAPQFPDQFPFDQNEQLQDRDSESELEPCVTIAVAAAPDCQHFINTIISTFNQNTPSWVDRSTQTKNCVFRIYHRKNGNRVPMAMKSYGYGDLPILPYDVSILITKNGDLQTFNPEYTTSPFYNITGSGAELRQTLNNPKLVKDIIEVLLADLEVI